MSVKKLFYKLRGSFSSSIPERILREIRQAHLIICLRKKNPDGNALGAQFGLKSFIQENWPKKRVLAPGDKNESLSFFGEPDVIKDEDYLNALVIVLGVPEKKFLTIDYQFLKTSAYKIIRIDHHPLTDRFADIDLVDPTSPSTTQILGLLVQNRGYKYPKIMARNWYGGLVTDTQNMNWGLIDRRTGSFINFCFSQNFDVQKILNLINYQSVARTKIDIFVLENIETHHDIGLVTSMVPQEIIGTTPQGSLLNLVSLLWNINGAKIVCLFTDDKTDKKIINAQIRIINDIEGLPNLASRYGGGGHNWAAGAYFPKSQIPNFIHDLEQLIYLNQK